MAQHQVPDWSVLHSVEEMQRLSNLGHRIEGVLLIIVALIALGEAAGIVKKKLLWPSVLVVAGLFLIGFLLLHHGLTQLKLVWNLITSDPQQRQHLVMAVLLTIAGGSEIVYRTKGYNIFRYVWPVIICAIGIMFLLHEQHGSSAAVEWAQTIHKYLGLLMILVAIFIVVGIVLEKKYRWTRYAWPLLLMATSIFLFIYKEPRGAYDKPNAHKQMNH